MWQSFAQRRNCKRKLKQAHPLEAGELVPTHDTTSNGMHELLNSILHWYFSQRGYPQVNKDYISDV